MRRCARCRNLESESDFYQRPDGRYGSYCTACRRARRSLSPRRSRSATTTPRGIFDRAFGIEAEFIGSMQAVAAVVRAVGVECTVEAYGHSTPRGWKVVTDMSVPGGGELVSPKLQGAAGFAELKKVLDAVAGVATVNTTTGLHVHLDASGESLDSIKRFVKGYVSRQDAIDGLVSRSRRCNGYAKRWTAADLDRLDRAESLSDLRLSFPASAAFRYRTVNVCSYARHGTVEVRQHQGSLNAMKVTAWVRFAMAAWTLDETLGTPSTYLMLDSMTELDTPTREYLKSRAYGFQAA